MNVEYRDVRVRLGGKDILTGANVKTREGQIVGIVGANGCGKSTLIKTTFGLVHNHGGSVLLGSAM